jgi:hypothetical protein
MSESARNANKVGIASMAMTTMSRDAIQMDRNDTSPGGPKRIFVPTLQHKVGDPEEDLWGVLGCTLIGGGFPPGRLILDERGYGDSRLA